MHQSHIYGSILELEMKMNSYWICSISSKVAFSKVRNAQCVSQKACLGRNVQLFHMLHSGLWLINNIAGQVKRDQNEKANLLLKAHHTENRCTGPKGVSITA